MAHQHGHEPPRCDGTLDDELTALALQLEELGAHHASGMDASAAHDATDAELAFAQYRAEVKNRYDFLADQQLASSIGAAVLSDGAAISTMAAEEIQCRHDRQLAVDTTEEDAYADTDEEDDADADNEKDANADEDEGAGVGVNADSNSKNDEISTASMDTAVKDWVKIAEENLCAEARVELPDDELYERGPSQSNSDRQAALLGKSQQKYTCVSCLDHHYTHRLISVPCNDRYCIDCLRNLFIRATTDETLYPVRCHGQDIPLELIAKDLSREELSDFERATFEFTSADRVYCSNLNRGKFILPHTIESQTGKATCDACSHTTCALCKSNYHGGSDCPDDPALRATREMAEELGWQTCYSCKCVVSLRSGCNHITCRCGAEFCYLCGTPWKNCDCDHVNEDNLLERAEEIVDRDGQGVLDRRERQRQIERMHAYLQQHHQCDHAGRFRRVDDALGDGPGRYGYLCELCGDRYWGFILECRRCHIRVCLDCRRNRI